MSENAIVLVVALALAWVAWQRLGLAWTTFADGTSGLTISGNLSDLFGS